MRDAKSSALALLVVAIAPLVFFTLSWWLCWYRRK